MPTPPARNKLPGSTSLLRAYQPVASVQRKQSVITQGIELRPAPPVYRPASHTVASPQPLVQRKQSVITQGIASRPAPPVYRPANHTAAAVQSPVQRKQLAVTQRVELRPAPPVYRPTSHTALSIQTMEREGGKKGANYFNNAKGEAAQERRRKAEEKYGATPGHGSRKPGVDAGISGATSTHEEKLNAEMRKQKAKDYKDSRPKADIKEQSPLNDFEKAKRMAEEMAATKESNELAGIDSEEDLQDNFDIYLVNRGFNFSPEQIDELYATFQIK